MSGKFIKFKKKAVTFITLAIIASQLMGCGSTTSDQFSQAVKNGQAVEVMVEVPDNKEQGTKQELTWVQLDKLDTYKEFRRNFEDALFITSFGADSKNGICYADLEGNHEGNNTLYNGFANNKFRMNYWNNEEVQEQVKKYAAEQFADVDEESTEAEMAALNAYYNILPDADPNYFNGDSLLTRGEFMSAVFRAETQVTDLSEIEDEAFKELVGDTEYTAYASALASDSYLDTESKSLNNTTFNGTMTRGEAVYMLMSHYYSSELESYEAPKDSKSGIKNAGNVAEKQGYTGDYGKSYELVYCIQNADKGAPEDIYKAIELAYEKGILEEGEQSRWDEGITKVEGLSLLVETYLSFNSQIAVDRGAGQAVELTDTDEADGVLAGIDDSRYNVSDEVPEYELSPEEIDYLNYLDEQEATNEKDSSDVEESDIEVLDKTMYAQGSVNTRSGPSTDFTKVGGLSTNQEVKVTGKSKSTGWYEIEVNGEKQYVSDRYLADTKITVTEQTSNTSNAGSTNTDNAGNTGTSSSGNTGSTNVGPDSNGNAVLPDSLKGLSMGDASSLANSQNQGESPDTGHNSAGEGIHAY